MPVVWLATIFSAARASPSITFRCRIGYKATLNVKTATFSVRNLFFFCIVWAATHLLLIINVLYIPGVMVGVNS